ncbi:hypothetical protein JVU11DRAFT_5263 [Chiua virens]|nr:hypothetical protein JVU11DRAFT_5263 [Chiua virens]
MIDRHITSSVYRRDSPTNRLHLDPLSLPQPPLEVNIWLGTPQGEANSNYRVRTAATTLIWRKARTQNLAEKSTLSRSRRKRFRTFILSNIFVPLLFRFINITFTTSALVVAIQIRIWETDYHVMGVVGSSPTLVIIFAPLTLLHVMLAIYVEYFSRPLGLWPTSGKLAHTLLEVCFICAWSAALSLCFDNYFTSPIPCAPASSIAWYSELPRVPLNSPGLGQIADTICDSQLALICLVMFGLITYCTNLVISLFRIFEKVKYHAVYHTIVHAAFGILMAMYTCMFLQLGPERCHGNPSSAAFRTRTRHRVRISHEMNEERRSRSRPPKMSMNDYPIGICLLLIVVLLWTSSNFVTQYMFTGGYEKPFMITYLSTASFTLYLVPSFLRRLFTGTLSQRKNTNYQPLSQDAAVQHEPPTIHSSREVEDRITPEETAKLAAYFCFLWFAANWTLNAALAYTSVASATVLSSMSGIFTLAFLQVSVVLSLYRSPIHRLVPASTLTTNVRPVNLLAILGDILALLSALFYAIYMIFLKVQIRQESRIDMQLFFGYVGLFNVLLGWPIAILLHWLKLESLELPGTKEAVIAIFVNMFITLSSDYIYVIAMLKTTPLVATVGLSLTIPLAVIGDYFLGKPATFQVLIGAILVTGAFIVVGVENSKPTEGASVQAQEPVPGEGMDQQGQRLEEAVPLESQTHAFDA